ncbi:MAG TPA: AgmX/PglI C-terminal domain-containing protein [Polyangiaceae bacterium]
MGVLDFRTGYAIWAFAASVAAVSACGGASREAKSADDASEEGEVPDVIPGLEVSGEIGGLNQEKVDETFTTTLGDLERCLNDGAERVEFLGGSVSFLVKIDLSGRLSHAFVEQSTLGDRETEKCMLSALRARDWPKPVGGDVGLARKSFEFDPPSDVRPPTPWSDEMLDDALGELKEELGDCGNGSLGSVTATMYVDTDGSVLAAGIAADDEAGEDAADCLAATLKGATFPSPGSWPAKVSFRL